MTTAGSLDDLFAAGDIFVLTGAGMSTESGIPDYRRPDDTRRTVPMTYQEFAAGEDARRRYWIRSAVGWERFARAEPNAGHHAVTRLQRAGLISSLVTQNVDGLHTEAGARDVVELHGNLARVRCAACGWREARDDFQTRLRAVNPVLPLDAELLADADAAVDARARTVVRARAVRPVWLDAREARCCDVRRERRG